MAVISTVQPFVIPTARRTPAAGAALGFIHIILALALLGPTALFGFITVAAITGAAVPPIDPFIPALVLIGPILLGVLTGIYALDFLLVLILGIGMIRLGGFSRGLAIVTTLLNLVVVGAQVGFTFPLTFFSLILAAFVAIPAIDFIVSIISAVYLSLRGVRAIYEPGAIGGLAAQALSGALPTLTSLQPSQQLTLLPTGAIPTSAFTQAGFGPPTLGPFPLPFPPFQSPFVGSPVAFGQPPIAAYSNPFVQMPQGFPQQGFPQFPQFGFPQGFPQQGFPQFGFPQGFPQQGFPQFGFPQVLSVYSSQQPVTSQLPPADLGFGRSVYCNECRQLSADSAAFCDHCGRRFDYR